MDALRETGWRHQSQARAERPYPRAARVKLAATRPASGSAQRRQARRREPTVGRVGLKPRKGVRLAGLARLNAKRDGPTRRRSRRGTPNGES